MAAPRKLPFQVTLTAILAMFVAVWSVLALFGVSFGLPVVAILLALLFGSSGGHRNRLSWPGVVTTVAIMAIGVQLGSPDKRTAYRRNSQALESDTRLKAVAKALRTYHAKYGHFPSACVRDTNGRPMHSWRVLILPELGYQDLYNDYRFDEPWDSTNNRALLMRIPKEYWCLKTGGLGGITSCVAVVGPQTMWPEDHPVRDADICDGVGQTIMIGEVGPDLGVQWLEPRDVECEKVASGLQRISWPPRGSAINKLVAAHPSPSDDSLNACVAHVVMADGRVLALPEDMHGEHLRALLTAAGGEPIDVDTVAAHSPSKTGKIASAILLVVSLGVMTMSLHRHRRAVAAQDGSPLGPSEACCGNSRKNPSGTV